MRFIADALPRIDQVDSASFELVTCLGNTLANSSASTDLSGSLDSLRRAVAFGGCLVIGVVNFEPFLKGAIEGLPDVVAGDLRFERHTNSTPMAPSNS